MAERSASILKGIGQNRAANTIKLRKRYSKFKAEQESAGETVLNFHEWAEKNFPDVKILK